MTDKDPKDMTASELVRWAVSSTGVRCDACEKMGLGCSEENDGSCRNTRDYIADKIDAELAKAREESLRRGAELWAKANGWPYFKEGENFGAWLDRCAIQRPRFEDGEPVQIGDKVLCWGDVHTVKRCAVELYGGGCLLLQYIDSPEERVKRPAPEVLGADGLPIKEGETVYDVDTGEAHVVRLPCAGTGKTFFEGGGYRDPAYLTHTPPDTQRKINADVTKNVFEYWGCGAVFCDDCPVLVDGKRPREWLGAESCHDAKVIDLLRRQRELDARTGGAE